MKEHPCYLPMNSQRCTKVFLVITLVLVPFLAITHAQWRPEIPPWGAYFENSVVVRTYYGDVKGFSVPWHIEDTYDTERTEGGPLWYQRRVNNFLGIPYALPPLGVNRFRVSVIFLRTSCKKVFQIFFTNSPAQTF